MNKLVFRVGTFRRLLNLWIGGTKEEFDKEIGEKYGLNYDAVSGVTIYDEENNKNIIWLRGYYLNTLVHELVHCTQFMCEQCLMQMKGEPPAFIYEELFCKIWGKIGNKFKIDKDTKSFYKLK